MEDICVVGLGGTSRANSPPLSPHLPPAVGVFYAYLLEKSGKARVTAVCR
jgi:hypothetical protein